MRGSPAMPTPQVPQPVAPRTGRCCDAARRRTQARRQNRRLCQRPFKAPAPGLLVGHCPAPAWMRAKSRRGVGVPRDPMGCTLLRRRCASKRRTCVVQQSNGVWRRTNEEVASV